MQHINRRVNWMTTTTFFWGILGLAAVLRFWNLTDWSLWQDEEGSIFLSHHIFELALPKFFPVFFLSLKGLFSLTGVSVGAGRALAAIFGLLSVWLTYMIIRRLVSENVALLSTLLVSLNLGHLFWSQSIRYYTMVMAFQLLCVYWFLDGFERGKYRSLILSNIALIFALMTHFSAVYMAPALILYLIFVMVSRQTGGGYCFKSYLVYTVPFLLILFYFSGRFLYAKTFFANQPIAEYGVNPVHILTTIIAYFGVPVIGLGCLSPFVVQRCTLRSGVFLMLFAFVPILELLVIAQLRLTFSAWQYVLIALPGCAALTALLLVGLYERGRKVSSALLGGVTVGYYLVFLGLYYTTMHGDRPRWEEAVRYLQQTAEIDIASSLRPNIFSTVPGVVAFYLGVAPDATWTYPLVRSSRRQTMANRSDTSVWYIVEAGHINPEEATRYEGQCELKARFEAQTGPIDRSVMIFRCPNVSATSGAG